MNALYFALKWKGSKSQFITISLGYVKGWSFFSNLIKKLNFYSIIYTEMALNYYLSAWAWTKGLSIKTIGNVRGLIQNFETLRDKIKLHKTLGM